MASDKQQYRELLRKRESLRHERAFSVPDDRGILAIICSFQPGDSDPDGAVSASDQKIAEFMEETRALASRAMRKRRRVECIYDASIADMRGVVRNPKVSSIITIGNGTLNALCVRGSDGLYGWRDALSDVEHLKLGGFVQRQCGVFVCDLNIPLGFSVMADLTSVQAAVGIDFDPKSLEDPVNDQIKPILDDSYDGMPSLRQLKRMFPRHERKARQEVSSSSVAPGLV